MSPKAQLVKSEQQICPVRNPFRAKRRVLLNKHVFMPGDPGEHKETLRGRVSEMFRDFPRFQQSSIDVRKRVFALVTTCFSILSLPLPPARAQRLAGAGGLDGRAELLEGALGLREALSDQDIGQIETFFYFSLQLQTSPCCHARRIRKPRQNRGALCVTEGVTANLTCLPLAFACRQSATSRASRRLGSS